MLSRRALNRATLARQLLLDRADLPAADAIRHLGGLQGQAPLAPYVGLWTRLRGFRPDDVVSLLVERRAVRAWTMRATVHLMDADDYLAWRPVLQPVLERSFRGQEFARNLAGVDLDDVRAEARRLLAEQPRTRAELGRLLQERWPDHDADSLAYAVSYLEPLAQVPPRGLWGRTGPAALTTVEAWLDRSEPPAPATVDELVLRYLGAFGPATVMDAQTWSGLTRLAEVFARLPLVALRSEAGATLYDLPDAPRPPEDTPAPPRFLPEYDNLLLSHKDRTRVNPANRRVPLPPGLGAATGTLLTDGEWTATWKLTPTALLVDPFTPIDEASVTAEAEALLRFLDASVPVDITPPPG
jgi:hypothetical protein